MKGFLLFLVLLTASCDAILPEFDNKERPGPQQLLLEINDARRFLTTDQLADLLINKDPSLLLIDVRKADAFARFSLPRAINIPLESLLEKEAQEQLDCDKQTIVFYSNDDLYADQAWVLQREQGCQDLYVLRGGLNQWTQTIIQPEEPAQTDPQEVWELYDFRQAARKYFTGGASELETLPYLPPIYQTTQPAPLKNIPLKAKKAVEEEEGC